MTSTFTIKTDELNAADVQALLDLHLKEAHADACSAALGKEALCAENITFFTARGPNGTLAGFTALKMHDENLGEIKSVRTHPDFLRQGVSSALMSHLVQVARAKQLTRLSLETHPTEAYAAARKLYERLGYTYCGAFGDYEDTEKSVFMTKSISESSTQTPHA